MRWLASALQAVAIALFSALLLFAAIAASAQIWPSAAV